MESKKSLKKGLLMTELKIVSYAYDSLVDGEGLRFVIFLPGCTHNCPGCQNPGLQDPKNHYTLTPEWLIKDIELVIDDIDGITLSGGDPLYDVKNTMNILRTIKNQYPDMNIWLYTGSLIKDVPNEILEMINVLVDGKFINKLPKALYRGSANQIVWEKKIKNGKIYYKNKYGTEEFSTDNGELLQLRH
jgi:anaerobic ribonucleoside-triphosphate reductase activating protein